MMVARTQLEKKVGNIIILSITDRLWCNTYHVPVYRYYPGDYSQGGAGSERRQVVTGGAEKEGFKVQLSCKKNGVGLPIYIIYKDAPNTSNWNLQKNIVAYELVNRIPDNKINGYPDIDKAIITWSKKENSNAELTIDILQKMIFPNVGIFEVNFGGVLVDGVKGHSRYLVK